MSDSFSKRHGFHQVHEAPITVRTDAPHEFRGVVLQLAYDCGFRPRTLRPLVCRTLRKRQDENNWTEHPNIEAEIRTLIDGCEWYRVYDVVEAIAKVAATKGYGSQVVIFDRYKEDREQIGRDLAAKHGLTLIPSYDHVDVRLGADPA